MASASTSCLACYWLFQAVPRAAYLGMHSHRTYILRYACSAAQKLNTLHARTACDIAIYCILSYAPLNTRALHSTTQPRALVLYGRSQPTYASTTPFYRITCSLRIRMTPLVQPLPIISLIPANLTISPQRAHCQAGGAPALLYQARRCCSGPGAWTT